MTPVLHRWKGYRFLFYSAEEDRAHLHVIQAENEMKVWLEPQIEVAYNYGVPGKDVKRILRIIRRQHHAFLEAWKDYHRRGG